MARQTWKGLGDKERRVLATLAALERPAVTAGDVVGELGLARAPANLALSRLARKGWLKRLKRGVYAVLPLADRSSGMAIGDPLATAMHLFGPCYVSGWTAAEHWDLTEQVHNTVIIYSARPQRKSAQRIGGVNYRVRRIPASRVFGTTRQWSGTVAIEIADVHRTLIDILDAPEMGGGGRQMLDIARAYWKKPAADASALLRIAERLGRGTVFKRLGFTTETFGRANQRWFEDCRKHLSAGVSLLDPSGPARGRIVSRWRLRINVPLPELP